MKLLYKLFIGAMVALFFIFVYIAAYCQEIYVVSCPDGMVLNIMYWPTLGMIVCSLAAVIACVLGMNDIDGGDDK